MNVKELIKTALDASGADLILKNGNVYNVFMQTVSRADIVIKDGIICGVGEYSGANEHDISGKFVLPGFIDSHMHVESSMVAPSEYARLAAVHGVTSVIADPHEIANVCGFDGIDFMKKSAAGVPIDFNFMLPSCVPCAPFDHTGAVITAADTKKHADEFFGIAEMMNYPGIISCDDEVLGKLIPGKIVDGHSPALSGHELDAYLSAGIRTDHECSEPEELREKVSKGMYIMLREGTLSKDISKLAAGVTHENSRRCLFCTDDRFIGEIEKDGSIDYCILKAVRHGISPYDAINMATINSAECYGLRLGAIAPSYRADLVIADDILPENISEVYKNGVLIARDGECLFEVPALTPPDCVLNTVHLKNITPDIFAREIPEELTAIKLIPETIVTKKVTAHRGDGLYKTAVLERHHNTGHMGFAYVTNYGIENGAVASSVGHDSHNVIVIGDNDADMAAAVNALGSSGGIAIVRGGKVISHLPLEIGGLMSRRTAAEVTAAHDELYAAARAAGVTDGIDPFLSLAFLPLPVIPEIRVTDSGLFDVAKFEFI